MPSCTLPAGAVDPDSPAGGHWTRVGRALFCALPSVAWGASLGSAGGPSPSGSCSSLWRGKRVQRCSFQRQGAGKEGAAAGAGGSPGGEGGEQAGPAGAPGRWLCGLPCSP